jgi:hypothetical protein
LMILDRDLAPLAEPRADEALPGLHELVAATTGSQGAVPAQGTGGPRRGNDSAALASAAELRGSPAGPVPS